MVFLYSSDRNYAKLSMVSIASLLENNKDVDSVKIYYINNDIGEDYKAKLNELVYSFGFEIEYIDASQIDTSFIKKSSYSISGYYRILITEMIAEPKIIYLDCDTIINGSFKELWNTNLNGFLFGAFPVVCLLLMVKGNVYENGQNFICCVDRPVFCGCLCAADKRDGQCDGCFRRDRSSVCISPHQRYDDGCQCRFPRKLFDNGSF